MTSKEVIQHMPSSETDPHEQQCPRRQTKREVLLHLDKSQLITQMSFRGNHHNEILHAARDANSTIRFHYKDFIHQVGRNVFPLIIASDHEVDGYSGVGSTLTLYRDDGSIETRSPCLGSYYELYKTASHFFMALAVEIGPFMSNDSVVCTTTATTAAAAAAACGGDLIGDQVNHSNDANNISSSPSSEAEADHQDIPQPWESSMTELVTKAQILRQSLLKTTAMESNNNCTNHQEDSSTNSTLPPPAAMRETIMSMLNSIIAYCQRSLSKKQLNLSQWTNLNQANFPLIKRCMAEATSLQANLCIRQILHWKDNVLTPQEWRELYVVIPTVWAVDRDNPRKEMFKRLMHPDRVETHLITSEWPRDHGEVRTLLGRIVGDRAIGRFVFGDDTEEQRVKTMGLSSGVDVVLDDALPAICSVLEELSVGKNDENNTDEAKEQWWR